MIRFGHHRRYSPERTWEPLSDTEWAVLSPFLFRAAEAEIATRREAALAAAQHPTRRPPRAPPRRPPRARPARAPRRHLLDGRQHPTRPRAPALARPAARVRQARHRLAPVPPLGPPGPLDQPAPGARRRRPPRHRRPAPPGELDLPQPTAAPGACSACRAWASPAASASSPRSRGPSWLLPDPDLSELVFSKLRAAMLRAREHGLRVLPNGFLRCYQRLLRIAAGRRRIRRCLAPP